MIEEDPRRLCVTRVTASGVRDDRDPCRVPASQPANRYSMPPAAAVKLDRNGLLLRRRSWTGRSDTSNTSATRGRDAGSARPPPHGGSRSGDPFGSRVRAVRPLPASLPPIMDAADRGVITPTGGFRCLQSRVDRSGARRASLPETARGAQRLWTRGAGRPRLQDRASAAIPTVCSCRHPFAPRARPRDRSFLDLSG
jgi:hypothetical protein